MELRYITKRKFIFATLFNNNSSFEITCHWHGGLCRHLLKLSMLLLSMQTVSIHNRISIQSKKQHTPSFKIFAQHYVDNNKIHSWTSALSQFDRHDFICRLFAIVNEFLMNVYIKSYAYWVVIAVGVRRKNGSLWSFIRFWFSLQCIRCIVVIPFLEYRTTIPLIIRGHQESVYVCVWISWWSIFINFLLFYFFSNSNVNYLYPVTCVVRNFTRSSLSSLDWLLFPSLLSKRFEFVRFVFFYKNNEQSLV